MTSKGRGFAIRGRGNKDEILQLRRPGVEKLSQDSTSPTEFSGRNNEFAEITSLLHKLRISESREQNLSILYEATARKCRTADELKNCVNSIFAFALESHENAHYSAIACNHLQELTVENSKLRNLILNKLQSNFTERNERKTRLNKFLMDVTFLCEVFTHLLLANGTHCEILTKPIFEYFGMLVEGGTQEEAEILIEMITKCYKNLKQYDHVGLTTLLAKIRKQIVFSTSGSVVRAILLLMLELIINDFNLSPTEISFYNSFYKPKVRIC